MFEKYCYFYVESSNIFFPIQVELLNVTIKITRIIYIRIFVLINKIILYIKI